MPPATAQTLVDDISGLISLPEVVLRLNQMVNADHSTAAEIAKVINQDPGLTTRLLKIANSPMYGTSRQVDTVVRAVTMLGNKQIRDLAFSTVASKLFKGMLNEVISVADFWRHSLYCGLLARTLAQASKIANPDTLFTAGLLHDIGQLIIFHRMPEQAHQIILLTVQGDANIDMVHAEQEIIGFDHTEVGAQLARNWHLPDVLCECIAYHHNPAQAIHFPNEVAVVHIANVIASLPYSDFPSAEDLQRIDPVALARVKLSPDKFNEAISQAQAQINATQELLFGADS
jgi:putative nucleotidyltransferase with HDIG domain